MITHRMSTRIQPEPPVKFYKTIAVSFLVLTVALLGVVIFFTSKKANVVIVAKSANKNINLSVDVASTNETGTVSGEVKSSEFGWSEIYYPTGSKEVEGIATGEVTLYNDSGLTQPLVKTTRLLSTDQVLFRLSDAVTVPANGSVKASVYADVKGSSGDIKPTNFTIPGLGTDRQKVVYAKSESNMMGGKGKVGMLTAEDIAAAKSDYVIKAKKAYLSKQETDSTSKERVVLVKTDVIQSDKESGQEVDSFVISGTSTIITVLYDQTELQHLINNVINNKIDNTVEKILSVGTEPQVSLASYNLVSKTARLSIYQDVLVTLDANGSKLAAVNFFEMDKEAIKRYIMGLSHVVGVDVKFSPSWMRKAPNAIDRIKVVVKNVK